MQAPKILRVSEFQIEKLNSLIKFPPAADAGGSFFATQKSNHKKTCLFHGRLWRCHPDSDRGMKVLQTFALPLGYGTKLRRTQRARRNYGAVDETRTRDLHLGKVALYQLSYYRKWCPGTESNHRHVDFQSTALPTELPGQVATRKGLEPSTSSVTGWHSNQLNYRTLSWWEQQGSNL